jgi:two-component system, sensor histidine kinase LadS
MRKQLTCFFHHAWLICIIVFGGLGSPMALADHSPALAINAEDAANLQVKVVVLHEQPGKMSLAQIQNLSTTSFKPLNEEAMVDLKPQDHLWIRLDLNRAENARDDWVIWISLPLIDSVTLYKQRDNELRQLRAGDRIEQSQWAEPGRYPRFNIELPAGSSTVYLKVQGSTPVSIPIQVGSVKTAQQDDRLGMLGLGSVLGVLITLLLVCMVTAYTYDDRLYFFYSVYVGVMILAVSAYTGLAGYLLWPESPKWADASQGCLAMLTAGGTLYFIEELLGGRQFARRQSQVLLTLGGIALPLAVTYYFLPRSAGVVLMGIYMLIVTATGLSLALRAWRRGDRVGQWVFFAYLPLACAVLLAIARAYGWVTVSWLVQYGVVAALIIETPFMMLALNLRSRQRHEIKTRELALNTQDALTGLLAEHIFDDRLRQTALRYAKRKEDAAIVLISLVNYEQISTAYGLPVAEQSVLRAVIKLRKVLRDADTVARVGTSHFGLILEGIGHRSRISEIGARLIAQGLMPLPGLVPEVTLQFHIASALMREAGQPGMEIKHNLMQLLGTMSSRTRRPIRFLEPVAAAVNAPVAVVAEPEVESASEFASTVNAPHFVGLDTSPSTQFEERSDWEHSEPNTTKTTPPGHKSSRPPNQTENSSLLAKPA